MSKSTLSTPIFLILSASQEIKFVTFTKTNYHMSRYIIWIYICDRSYIFIRLTQLLTIELVNLFKVDTLRSLKNNKLIVGGLKK